MVPWPGAWAEGLSQVCRFVLKIAGSMAARAVADCCLLPMMSTAGTSAFKHDMRLIMRTGDLFVDLELRAAVMRMSDLRQY